MAKFLRDHPKKKIQHLLKQITDELTSEIGKIFQMKVLKRLPVAILEELP